MTPEQHLDVGAALFAYWTARDDARVAQGARGVVDQGNRAGVTSGGHLDRVAQLFARVCRKAGAPASEVYYKAPADDPFWRPGMKSGYTLPGFFRPTKDWDLVVWANNQPIIVLELKSQNGPSYGNNANNRAEEAIGNAVDLERARVASLIPGRPWTGYIYVIEDDEISNRPGGNRDPSFLARDPKFASWSYTKRVRELSHRLVQEGHYDGAWPVGTRRPPDFAWRELDPSNYGYGAFVDAMIEVVHEFYQ